MAIPQVYSLHIGRAGGLLYALPGDLEALVEGGDAQRLHSISTRWDALTYKHVLLPVWLLVVRYREHPYQLIVNAATGEDQGERPWSALKLAAPTAAAAALHAVGVAWHQGWL